MFPKNIDGDQVKAQAKEIVVGIIQEKHYFPEAFEYIRRKTKRGILAPSLALDFASSTE